MNHERRTEALLLLVLGMSGCVLPDTKLGEGAESSGDSGADTLDSSDGGTDSTTSASATSSSTISASNTSTSGAGLPGVGAACDHDGVVESRLLTYPAADCEGEVCLYADGSEPSADLCATNEDCNESNPALARFLCVLPEGTCGLNPAYVAERSMCSAFCEDDSQCVTDEATNCVSGFRCEPQSTLGDACCRPVCVCNDDLDEAIANQLRNHCVSGQAVECCDTLPGNGLCPG